MKHHGNLHLVKKQHSGENHPLDFQEDRFILSISGPIDLAGNKKKVYRCFQNWVQNKQRCHCFRWVRSEDGCPKGGKKKV
jgi:uncharacterized protein YifE (UPF0438 family)